MSQWNRILSVQKKEGEVTARYTLDEDTEVYAECKISVRKSTELGDINEDGEINLFALMQCLNHVAKKITLTGNAFQAEDIALPESIMIGDTAFDFNDRTCLIKNDYLGFAEAVPVKADRVLADGNELTLVDNCIDIKDLIEGEHTLDISFVHNGQTYTSEARTYFMLPSNSKSDDEFLEYANSVIEDAKDKRIAIKRGNFLEQSWERLTGRNFFRPSGQ